MKKQDIEKLLYTAIKFKPEYYGISLMQDGWVNIDDLIYRINFLHGEEILNKSIINKIVNGNPKFSINVFRTKIKANQTSELKLTSIKKTIPPDVLYYIDNSHIKGKKNTVTVENVDYFVLQAKIPSNLELEKIFTVDSRKMFAAGYTFFMSESGHYVTEKLPNKFVTCMKNK